MPIGGASTVGTVGRLPLSRGVGESLSNVGKKQRTGKDADNNKSEYKDPINLTHLS
jgi:hypothetical protein